LFAADANLPNNITSSVFSYTMQCANFVFPPLLKLTADLISTNGEGAKLALA
jgi:hypothetical protein